MTIQFFFFVCTNRRNLLIERTKDVQKTSSKVKFGQASNRCKRVLEAVKLAYANKTKEFISSQKLGSWDFWRIVNIQQR